MVTTGLSSERVDGANEKFLCPKKPKQETLTICIAPAMSGADLSAVVRCRTKNTMIGKSPDQ